MCLVNYLEMIWTRSTPISVILTVYRLISKPLFFCWPTRNAMIRHVVEWISDGVPFFSVLLNTIAEHNIWTFTLTLDTDVKTYSANEHHDEENLHKNELVSLCPTASDVLYLKVLVYYTACSLYCALYWHIYADHRPSIAELSVFGLAF